ncbi:uncharacterized protein LOC126682542 [Mercurialis annua]|uniref:uncharacterized protein LOC126682542 n=1 Tax=Mercurialis annua TaxID=3986 RepID=UPI00215FFEDE|nr:uncharacterized protein LOC126682542 [Mercurialis annua]
MTETSHPDAIQKKRRRRCFVVAGGILFVVLLILIVIVILALTIFKVKQPKVELVSASLNGIAPRISFPLMNVQLNISLDLELLVNNRNYASFKHGVGKSFLMYQGKQVGEADLSAGLIPSRGTVTLPCRLTIQVDELASDMGNLIRDIMAGQLVMETHTTIPGRVTILGFVKKHAVAISDCRFTVAFPSMEILSQQCKSKTKTKL